MNNTHSETFTIRGTECDMFSRWRLDAMFLNMQEVGEVHARQLGVGYDAMLSKGLFFALTRVHVSVFHAMTAGQCITHTTWPGETNRFFCPRYHAFYAEDGTLLAAAGALWVVLDMEKRTIVSPLKLELNLPDNRSIEPPITLPTRMPVLSEDALHIARTPVYSEFDVNRHINNTKYIAWLCDAIGRNTLEHAFIGDFVAGYEKEIREEKPLDLAISVKDDAFTFCVSSGNEKHFVAGGTLRREENHE
ncbi:MAG: hypothetical protein IKB82_03475 [Clostridia bacterium]|nr:hypothetical protein [Clostridia bacterium]